MSKKQGGDTFCHGVWRVVGELFGQKNCYEEEVGRVEVGHKSGERG